MLGETLYMSLPPDVGPAMVHTALGGLIATRLTPVSRVDLKVCVDGTTLA